MLTGTDAFLAAAPTVAVAVNVRLAGCWAADSVKSAATAQNNCVKGMCVNPFVCPHPTGCGCGGLCGIGRLPGYWARFQVAVAVVTPAASLRVVFSSSPSNA